MSLKVLNTNIPGVLLIETKVSKDSRGFFTEVFHKNKYTEIGIKKEFAQDNYSHSRLGTLRGLHYQLKDPQGELVYVITGEIFDVVDIRYGPSTFGQWEGYCLSSENRRQIFVPERFAHGFCVLSETANVVYKCTEIYNQDDGFGVLWSSHAIDINWPVNEPTVSEKDSRYLSLDKITRNHLPNFQS